MTEPNWIRNYKELISGIEICLSKGLLLPVLVLIFTAIDTVGWLASEDQNQGVGKRFRAWVDKWMLQKYPLPCTAEELYQERCAILHTLTPGSRLTKEKGVRRIAYAWGDAKLKDLEESIKLTKYPMLVAVHVDDIFLSFRNGFADFLEMLESHPASKKIFIQKANKHFANMDKDIVSEFLASAKKGKT